MKKDTNIKAITYGGGKLKGYQGGSKASPYVFLEYFDFRIVYNLIKDKFLSKICGIISGCSGHARFTKKICGDSVDSSPIPHTQFPCYQYLPLYSIFTTTVESLLIVKVHTSFICP